MPEQNFLCPRCGYEGIQYYPLPQYDHQHNRIDEYPSCPACARIRVGPHHTMEVLMIPKPTTMNHDLLTGGLGLTVPSASGGEVQVSSLSEIRTIENESLRRARNGDGTPLVFRGFAQNRSNMQTNTLAGSSFETNKQLPYSRRTQSGQPITAAAVPEQKE